MGSFSFGEELSKLVLDKILASSRSVPAYFRQNPFDNKLIYIKDFNLLEYFQQKLGPGKIETEVNAGLTSLDMNKKKKTFNALHQVDVLIHNDTHGFGLEVKLGLTGGAKTFPKAFYDKWRSEKFEYADESESIIKGSMITIFDLMNGYPVKVGGKDFINDAWGLVLRRDTIKARADILDVKFTNLSLVLTFED